MHRARLHYITSRPGLTTRDRRRKRRRARQMTRYLRRQAKRGGWNEPMLKLYNRALRIARNG